MEAVTWWSWPSMVTGAAMSSAMWVVIALGSVGVGSSRRTNSSPPSRTTRNEPEATDYWLSNLDAKTLLRELVGLAKLRWRVKYDYRELTRGLGLDYFEGRSLPGWYRHVTLASLAHAICTQLRYDPEAPRWPDPV